MATPPRIDLDCPLCSQRHTYLLDIQRSLLQFGAADVWRERDFTCLFICPTNHNKFQARITLQERKGEPIISVDADPA